MNVCGVYDRKPDVCVWCGERMLALTIWPLRNTFTPMRLLLPVPQKLTLPLYWNTIGFTRKDKIRYLKWVLCKKVFQIIFPWLSVNFRLSRAYRIVPHRIVNRVKLSCTWWSKFFSSCRTFYWKNKCFSKLSLPSFWFKGTVCDMIHWSHNWADFCLKVWSILSISWFAERQYFYKFSIPPFKIFMYSIYVLTTNLKSSWI